MFGKDNFRNEIAWCYRCSGNRTCKDRKLDIFLKKHDTILRFTPASASYTFNKNSSRVDTSKRANAYQHTEGSILKLCCWGSKSKEEITGNRSTTYIPKEAIGKPVEDWWADIGAWDSHIGFGVKMERTNYPTQKPKKLLQNELLKYPPTKAT